MESNSSHITNLGEHTHTHTQNGGLCNGGLTEVPSLRATSECNLHRGLNAPNNTQRETEKEEGSFNMELFTETHKLEDTRHLLQHYQMFYQGRPNLSTLRDERQESTIYLAYRGARLFEERGESTLPKQAFNCSKGGTGDK